MSTVTKKYTKNFEIIATSYPTSLGTFAGVARKRALVFGDPKMDGLKTCFRCNRQFANDEDVYLTLVKGHKNVFLCKKCAEAESGKGSQQ